LKSLLGDVELVEFEEDKEDETPNYERRRNSSTLIIDPMRPREQAQTQNDKYISMAAQGVSPVMID
jgi:hypothetical protein